MKLLFYVVLYIYIHIQTHTHIYIYECMLSRSVVSNSFVTPWAVAHQAPLAMGISRQEYWSRLLFPSSGDVPNPGIKPASPVLTGRFIITEPPRKP